MKRKLDYSIFVLHIQFVFDSLEFQVNPEKIRLTQLLAPNGKLHFLCSAECMNPLNEAYCRYCLLKTKLMNSSKVKTHRFK